MAKASLQPAAAAVSESTQKRFYRGTDEIDHDLFKLETSVMKKNMSYLSDSPYYNYVEHCHFFHTVDSSGKKQEHSTAVGGHFHSVAVNNNANGIPTVIVGPAMRMIRTMKNGKPVKVTEALTDDTHTHEATYKHSQKIKIREANVEAAKFQSAIQAKQSPGSIDGISG